MADDSDRLRELVANVAAGYFSNAQVAPSEISDVMRQIWASLERVGQPQTPAPPSAATAPAGPDKPTKAQVRRSITPDALISFEDGKPYKMLRKHLAIRGLTPEQYREKWGLPRDYPMTSPSYSAARSSLAKTIGLGQKRRGRAMETT